MTEDELREQFYVELTEHWTDIGHGHKIRWASWRPDRELNPQYADLPDVEHAALSVYHLTPDGKPCVGGVVPDSCPDHLRGPNRPTWTIERLDPLTLSPSLLCVCGDHGFIRDGRWVPA
jgi:hypothetical protein